MIPSPCFPNQSLGFRQKVDATNGVRSKFNRREHSNCLLAELFNPTVCSTDEDEIECNANQWDVLSRV